MKKRGIVLSAIIGILLISLVSAFKGIIYSTYFDESMIAWGAVFIIIFAVINFALGRTAFRDQVGAKTAIAFAIALLAVYGLTTKDFSIGAGYVGNWYVGEYLPTILTLIFLAGAGFLLYKFGLARVLIGAGLALIGLSFTGLVYEDKVVLIVGIFLLISGIFLLFRRRTRRERRPPRPPRPGPGPTPPPGPTSKYSKKNLIKLAKKFKKYVKKQKNPGFSGGYMKFINKVYKWGYIGSATESDIIYSFGVTEDELRRIFRRYGKI